MKHLIAFLIPTLCLIGCVSSNEISREWTLEKANQYAEINAQGREYRATITVHVDSVHAGYESEKVTFREWWIDSVTVQYDGDFVSILGDSVQWLDPETHVGRSAATVNLRRIGFHKSFVGMGAMIGLATGGIIYGIGAATDEGGPHIEGNGGKLLGVYACIIGPVLGVLTGLVGHQTDYVFPAP